MKTCDDEFCDEPRYAKHRHCKMHRNMIRRKEYVPAPAKPPCHCGEKHHARGLCKIHYLEWWRREHGIPERPPAKPKPERKRPKKVRAKAPVPKEKKERKVKEVVGYRGAHLRVEKAKGKASDQTCVCGQPAREWSLDPNAVHTYEEGNRVWSMNVDDYTAYCIPCHRERDGGYHWHDMLD